MIVGLERSNPSAISEHPVLFALNLSRPEWPPRLPLPVVFWVPEYLLGLLEREAPDFMDWRSDTVFFPEPAEENLVPLDARLWGGKSDRTMPESQRRARMEELRLRLLVQPVSEDLVSLAGRAGWLSELGQHVLLLGELADAERCFREALAIGERLDLTNLVASLYGSLGAVLEAQGRLDEAEAMVRLAIAKYSDDEAGLAVNYGNLGILLNQQGRSSEAEALFREALALHSHLGDSEGTTRNLLNLARVSLELGNLADAEKRTLEGMLASIRIKNLQGMATAFGELALIFTKKGDFQHAESLLQTALEFSLQLGDRAGVAALHQRSGLVRARRGERAGAREEWTLARDLYREMGMIRRAEQVDAWLATQNSQTSPPPIVSKP